MGRSTRLTTWVIPALLILGAALRLRQYAALRPLWQDEAMLALNVATRSFAGLATPLDLDQSAPLLFLWIERAFLLLLGVSELSLRLFPLLAGLLLPLVVYRMAVSLLPRRSALLALALTVISPALVYFSNETKPYGPDALVAALLMLCTIHLLEHPDSGSRWLLLGAAGVLGLLGSTPALLVMASAICALGLALASLRDRQTWLRYGLLGMAWCGCAAILSLTVWAGPRGNPYLRTYWGPAFLHPLSGEFAVQLKATAGRILQAIFLGDGLAWRAVVGFVFLVPVVAGFVSLRHARGLPVALAVAGPAAAAVAASLLGIYPLAPRLSLFIAPALILLAAEGIRILAAALSARAPGADRIWFLLMATAALAVAVRTDFKEWRVIHRREDTRPLVEILEERNTQGEPVYVFGRAGTAWLFYTTDWNAPDLARIRGWSALLSSSGLAFRNAPTRGHRVRDEGLDLAFPYRGRVELLGIPTGQGPDSGVRSRATPDPGWAENEARRIRAASDSAAWVFLASFLPASRDALAGAISSLGGREVLRLERTHALLLRYQFPRDTVAASRPSGSR